MPCLTNSVDPDQLASEEANWSGSALFDIKYVNFYQKPRSSNLIGWKLEVGRGILIYSDSMTRDNYLPYLSKHLNKFIWLPDNVWKIVL